MKDTKTDFKNMREMLESAKTIAIAMHLRPDGDALGTAAALRTTLLRMKKQKVEVFVDGDIPSTLKYIDGVDKFRGTNYKLRSDDRFDLLIIVDTGDAHRLGFWQQLLGMAEQTIVFDHHLNPSIKADLLVSNPTRASTGEMLYEFLVESEIRITRPMAEAIYTAVSSDTGCFMFPNTTWHTHHTAAELMKLGINIAQINYANFRVFNPKTLKGMTEVIRQIQFTHEGRIAITYLSNKMVKKYKFDHDERHRFQRYASDAEGVMVSIFLTEQERDEFNISLRSHGDLSVADIAAHFGGGGHKNAAGITMRGRYKDIIKQITARAEEEIAKHPAPETGS